MLNRAIKASIEAGKKILQVYETDFISREKADRTPLTEADLLSHETILGHLTKTSLPVMSEEGSSIAYAVRSEWRAYWLVDPLDGTKEFINRNGEFTVNIALIEEGVPVLGVILAPVTGLLYFAARGIGSYRYRGRAEKDMPDLDSWIRHSDRLPLGNHLRNLVIIGSRSHSSPETEAFVESLKKFSKTEFTSRGSSLKLCLVAEGSAHIYPRLAPTMEWDTAAGQAIVENAGFKVLEIPAFKPMRYNKENLLNPWFICSADPLPRNMDLKQIFTARP